MIKILDYLISLITSTNVYFALIAVGAVIALVCGAVWVFHKDYKTFKESVSDAIASGKEDRKETRQVLLELQEAIRRFVYADETAEGRKQKELIDLYLSMGDATMAKMVASIREDAYKYAETDNSFDVSEKTTEWLEICHTHLKSHREEWIQQGHPNYVIEKSDVVVQYVIEIIVAKLGDIIKVLNSDMNGTRKIVIDSLLREFHSTMMTTWRRGFEQAFKMI